MVKIAKGKSGQAKLRQDVTNPGCYGGAFFGYTNWIVGNPNLVAKNVGMGYEGQPGWNVSSSGVVTVPLDADLGIYEAVFSDLSAECGADAFEGSRYEFEVTCVKATISATEIERDEITLLSCRAIVEGGEPDYEYDWSVQGQDIDVFDGQGTEEAIIRLQPGASGSVTLLVTDSGDPIPCTDTDTLLLPALPLGEFDISTIIGIPVYSGAGAISGTRDGMQFEVTVEATATTSLPSPTPASINLQGVRNLPIVGVLGTRQLTATLVPSSSPPKYRALWNVTTEMGKWDWQVEFPYKSNTTDFKVNKRGQIVAVAESWEGATNVVGCDEFVGIVYNHLQLSIAASGTGDQYAQATHSCSGDGCILFYSRVGAPVGDVAHNAIHIDGERINVNSNTHPGTTVWREDINDGVLTVDPGVPYKAAIEFGSVVDLDED